MATSEVIAVASACIAGLALVQSWLAGRKASKATAEANDLIKQQVALQDRLTQIEQSREHAKLMQSLQAVIRAVLRKTDRGNWRLFVTNTGQGTARNVTITLDGKPLLEPASIARIARQTPGYAGYQLVKPTSGGLLKTPEDRVTLGDREYFALGDNTRNSRDGRYWGAVPESNLVGPAVMVYWPFSRRWGLSY